MLFGFESIYANALQHSTIRVWSESLCKAVRLAISGDTGLAISVFCASCAIGNLSCSLSRSGTAVKFTDDQLTVYAA